MAARRKSVSRSRRMLMARATAGTDASWIDNDPPGGTAARLSPRTRYKTESERAVPDHRARDTGTTRRDYQKHHILKYKNEATIIPRSTFNRLIRATYKYILGYRDRDYINAANANKTKRVHRQALRLLQYAAQTMLIELMRDAQLLATHAKRPTVLDRDIVMAIKINPRYQQMFIAPDDADTFDTDMNWVNMAERTTTRRVRIKPEAMPVVRAVKPARSLDVHLYTGRQKDAIAADPLKNNDDSNNLTHAINFSTEVLKTTACRRARDKMYSEDAELTMARAAKECNTTSLSASESRKNKRISRLLQVDALRGIRPELQATRTKHLQNACAGLAYNECDDDDDDDGDGGDGRYVT